MGLKSFLDNYDEIRSSDDLKKIADYVSEIQDNLTSEDFCEIMVFLFYRIKAYAEIYAYYDKDLLDQKSFLSNGVFALCLKNIEKHIKNQTIKLHQVLRVLDIIHPFDVIIKPNGTLKIGSFMEKFLKAKPKETNHYLLTPIILKEKFLQPKVYHQYVFEKFLDFFHDFETIRLFSACPYISYKKRDAFGWVADSILVTNLTPSEFIANKINSQKDPQIVKEWKEKLLKDIHVDPGIKELLKI